MKLWNLIGIDDLEGLTFGRFTTDEKAIKAKNILENEGFDGALDIVQDSIPIDMINLEGKNIEIL